MPLLLQTPSVLYINFMGVILLDPIVSRIRKYQAFYDHFMDWNNFKIGGLKRPVTVHPYFIGCAFCRKLGISQNLGNGPSDPSGPPTLMFS